MLSPFHEYWLSSAELQKATQEQKKKKSQSFQVNIYATFTCFINHHTQTASKEYTKILKLLPEGQQGPGNTQLISFSLVIAIRGMKA